MTHQHVGVLVLIVREHAVVLVRGLYDSTFLGWQRGPLYLWDPVVKMKLQRIAELNTSASV